ncbi:MAG: thioesterase family protein [Pseudomonadota bacterium]
MTFAEDTAVTAAGSHYTGLIAEGWDIVGNTNGGYLLAVAARAMAAASKPHPVAVTAHYLAPGRPGPITIVPTVVKQGRQFSTVSAQLIKDERPLVQLLGSFANLEEVEGPMRIDAAPPELPDPEDCVIVQAGEQGFPPPIMSKVDLRLHPDDAQFMAGTPSGRPEFRGWLRMIDEPADPFALLMAADVFPPTVFNANLPVAWTPTVELTAHVRGIPVEGWLRCRFSTRFISGGMLEEDGEIWDDSGRLVAQSRQLALAPRA